MKVEVEALSYSYEEQKVLDAIELQVPVGAFVGVIGPNGSGKSTLLKNIYRSLAADTGVIRVDNQDIAKLSFRQSALKMAVVGQEHELPFDFQVQEIVAMGRYPHKKLFATEDRQDEAIIQRALEQIGVAHLADKNFQHLSGGEKQRVLIARALAQECQLLVLDEPTNHLDIHYQLEIFQLLRKLDVTVISAIHDLNIAALYCDTLCVMQEGKLVNSGAPAEVLTSTLLAEVFRVQAEVSIHKKTQKPVITYLPY